MGRNINHQFGVGALQRVIGIGIGSQRRALGKIGRTTKLLQQTAAFHTLVTIEYGETQSVHIK